MTNGKKDIIVIWETSGKEPIDKWLVPNGKHKLGLAIHNN